MRTGTVLVESGQTPSGFGLALHKSSGSWRLRPLSPCCGHFIDHTDDVEELRCTQCNTSWQAYADLCRGTIGNDVALDPTGTAVDATLSRWYARIMQLPNPEGNHGVAVDIRWT